jgi:hypothetical protein
VEGNVSAIGDTLKISIHLLDGNTQHHVWGRHFRCKHSDPQCSAQLDELAQTGLWLDALRRRDFESAYHEAKEYTLGNFWRPLMQATALAHMGDPDKAGADVEQLLLMRPNFRQRGHWFITRYVKFEELVERITEGLEKAGLRIA